MADNKITKMPKNENAKPVDSIGNFIFRNRTVLITVVCLILAGLVGFMIFEKVSASVVSKALGQIDKAEFALEKDSLELSDAELMTRYDDTLKSVEPYESKGGIVGARALLLKAEIYFRKHDFEKAAGFYTDAAKKVKRTYLEPVCYFNAAAAYEELNDTAKALEYYEFAANHKEFPDPTRALFEIGRIKESSMDYTGAKEAYEKITAQGNAQNPWENLAKSRILSMQIDGKIE